jgi:hypothetical protein
MPHNLRCIPFTISFTYVIVHCSRVHNVHVGLGTRSVLGALSLLRVGQALSLTRCSVLLDSASRARSEHGSLLVTSCH